jgi:glycosyltransferase involved in cell wall biosynthesis
MAPPLVSIVIPAYNAARFVGRAIESVLNQTYPHWELIVVDDGSTDATPTIVQAYGERLRYICQRNARQAAARNRGVAESRGELIAFLDADDVWRDDKLARQVELLSRNPRLGFVYCLVDEIDATGRVLGQRRGGLRGNVMKEILLREPSGGLCGSTMVISRSRLMEAGGFDVDLPPCEDTDLFWRVAASHPIDYVPEPLAQHRLHETNAHANVRRMTRAWKRLYRKAFRDTRVTRMGIGFRRRCYAGLYYMLSGDHARCRLWSQAAAYAAASALLSPTLALRIIHHATGRRRRSPEAAWKAY